MYPGDQAVAIPSQKSVHLRAWEPLLAALRNHREALRSYIKTLMISDCSLFTMIPGFCTPVVQDLRLASGRLSARHGDLIWAAYHRAVRPATVGGSLVKRSVPIKTPRSSLATNVRALRLDQRQQPLVNVSLSFRTLFGYSIAIKCVAHSTTATQWDTQATEKIINVDFLAISRNFELTT